MRITRAGALVGVGTLLLLVSMTAPVYATSSGTGILYMYQDSSASTLFPQTTTGTLGYIVGGTGTTVYIVVTGITETAALAPPGCSGSSCTSTNIKLQWGGYTEILTNVLLTEHTTGCPGAATVCWTAGPVAWTVGTFGSSTGVSITCGSTGIVTYGQGSSSSTYYTTINVGGSSAQGHFFGAGTTSSGSCATAVPEFPLGPALLFAAAIPALMFARRSIRLPRA